MSDLSEYVSTLARAAKKASAGLRTLSAQAKNLALSSMAAAVDAGRAELVRAKAATSSAASRRGFPAPCWTGSPSPTSASTT